MEYQRKNEERSKKDNTSASQVRLYVFNKKKVNNRYKIYTII